MERVRTQRIAGFLSVFLLGACGHPLEGIWEDREFPTSDPAALEERHVIEWYPVASSKTFEDVSGNCAEGATRLSEASRPGPARGHRSKTWTSDQDPQQ